MPDRRLDRLSSFSHAICSGEPLLQFGGRILAVGSDYIQVNGIQELATINGRVEFGQGERKSFGNIVQITDTNVWVVPFDHTEDIRVGSLAYLHQGDPVKPNDEWLGRVVDSLGTPLDERGPIRASKAQDRPSDSLRGPVKAMSRARVSDGLKTGVRVIDIFTPLCYGQRMGIFAGSGVGKSTLLGMLAQADAFDCVVVALVGERGREVREFLEDSIGENAMSKTVCVVATSDQSAMMRKTAPVLAMQVAMHFRNSGKRVLYLLDSVTRFAHAIREVASSAGEAPVARGYPPSVFAEIPKLLECAGQGEIGSGSITALVSVLVDGDDLNDPIADAVRGILDGHIVLDREIAGQGRYPPVDILASLSRLAPRIWTSDQQVLVQQLRALIARYEDTQDLRMLGNWRSGVDEFLDKAVATVPVIYSGLNQSPSELLSIDAFSDLLAHMKNQDRESKDDKHSSKQADLP